MKFSLFLKMPRKLVCAKTRENELIVQEKSENVSNNYCEINLSRKVPVQIEN